MSAKATFKGAPIDVAVQSAHDKAIEAKLQEALLGKVVTRVSVSSNQILVIAADGCSMTVNCDDLREVS